MRKITKISVQLFLAVILCLSGVSLLYMGFWVAPTGQIDNSVLIGFGEISTFVGALMGMDYNYRHKILSNQKNDTDID